MLNNYSKLKKKKILSKIFSLKGHVLPLLVYSKYGKNDNMQNWIEWIEVDLNGQNGLIWTKVDCNRPKWNDVDRNGPSGPNGMKWTEMH